MWLRSPLVGFPRRVLNSEHAAFGQQNLSLHSGLSSRGLPIAAAGLETDEKFTAAVRGRLAAVWLSPDAVGSRCRLLRVIILRVFWRRFAEEFCGWSVAEGCVSGYTFSYLQAFFLFFVLRVYYSTCVGRDVCWNMFV